MTNRRFFKIYIGRLMCSICRWWKKCWYLCGPAKSRNPRNPIFGSD